MFVRTYKINADINEKCLAFSCPAFSCPAFLRPAIACPANWSVILTSCIFDASVNSLLEALYRSTFLRVGVLFLVQFVVVAAPRIYM